MRIFCLILILLFNINIPVYSQMLDNKENRPAHYMLPFTTKEYLKPCSDYFNVQEAYEKSLSCSNDKVFSKKPYNKRLNNLKDIPQCLVISKESPDIVKTRALNYLNITPIIGAGIVGFYDDDTNTIFVIENFDQILVLIHEYQHYFLRIADGDANGEHDHNIWKKCSPPKYTPSDENLKQSLN